MGHSSPALGASGRIKWPRVGYTLLVGIEQPRCLVGRSQVLNGVQPKDGAQGCNLRAAALGWKGNPCPPNPLGWPQAQHAREKKEKTITVHHSSKRTRHKPTEDLAETTGVFSHVVRGPSRRGGVQKKKKTTQISRTLYEYVWLESTRSEHPKGEPSGSDKTTAGTVPKAHIFPVSKWDLSLQKIYTKRA